MWNVLFAFLLSALIVCAVSKPDTRQFTFTWMQVEQGNTHWQTSLCNVALGVEFKKQQRTDALLVRLCNPPNVGAFSVSHRKLSPGSECQASRLAVTRTFTASIFHEIVTIVKKKRVTNPSPVIILSPTYLQGGENGLLFSVPNIYLPIDKDVQITFTLNMTF